MFAASTRDWARRTRSLLHRVAGTPPSFDPRATDAVRPDARRDGADASSGVPVRKDGIFASIALPIRFLSRPARRIARSLSRPVKRLVKGIREARLAARPLPAPRAPEPDDADPIGSAVARGAARNRPPPAAVFKAAGRYFSRHAPEHDPDEALAQLLGFVEAHPADERLQVLAARMLERSRFGTSTTAAWNGVSERFPGSTMAFARRMARMSRDRGAEAAHSWMLARFPTLPDDRVALASYAVGFSQLNEFDLADRAHERLLHVASRYEESYLLYAKSLERRGEHDRAARVLEQGRTALGERKGLAVQRARLSQRADALRRTFPELGADGNTESHAILRLLLEQAARGRTRPEPSTGPIGRILLVSGSLGAGGAERQFAATVLRLQAARGGDPVAGRTIAGPIGVVCRSLTSREGADFFLPAIAAAEVPVIEMEALPEARGRGPASCVAPYRRFLDHLPPRIAEGVLRLSDELRAQAPEVVHIWQDGMVLSAGAAAVIAGVPRIVLSVRTMPPVDRLGRKKPEYETLYRSLLSMPGVSLTANSARAAERYAQWLDLAAERVRVVRNGVRQLPAQASEATRALDAAFAARNAASGFTVGCVMRFDENKRPGPWLDVAQRVLAAVSDARFILVGDGPLLESTRERAQALGLAERVLFVGRSTDVGFWLARMSVFLLLSHIEGLPNGTIEAQLAGVPVVTTPAGGAAETVLPGITGEVLPSADRVDPDQVAALLIALAEDPARLGAMSREAAAWATRTFSVEAMIAATVAAYAE